MNRRQFIGMLAVAPFIDATKVLADVQLPMVAYPEYKPIDSMLIRFQNLSGHVNLWRVLWAIGGRETGHNPRVIGIHGERSEFQIKKFVWKKYCSKPFHLATDDPLLAQGVAMRHMTYLNKYLGRWNHDSEGRYVGDRVFDLALAWHYGLTGMKEHDLDNEYGLAVKRLFCS